MLRTIQCSLASACARKSLPRVHSEETGQDKTSSTFTFPHTYVCALFLTLPFALPHAQYSLHTAPPPIRIDMQRSVLFLLSGRGRGRRVRRKKGRGKKRTNENEKRKRSNGKWEREAKQRRSICSGQAGSKAKTTNTDHTTTTNARSAYRSWHLMVFWWRLEAKNRRPASARKSNTQTHLYNLAKAIGINTQRTSPKTLAPKKTYLTHKQRTCRNRPRRIWWVNEPKPHGY